MKENIRKKLKDPSHPFKDRLRKLGIPQRVAAHNIGVGFQQFIKYLNGSCRMPSQVEQNLNKLIQDIE